MRHPIGFKPSWPRLLYKPGERERVELPAEPLVDLVGSDFLKIEDSWESPDSDDGDED